MWSLGFDPEALELEQSIPAFRVSDADAHLSAAAYFQPYRQFDFFGSIVT